MADLTIRIPDEVLERARIRADRDGTSVNDLVRRFLGEYTARAVPVREAVEDVLRMAKESTCDGGGRKWTREEIHRRG